MRRRRRPVTFRSDSLLGGASLVVPHGTAVRLPAAPASLVFAGYNALAARVHVAGLGGGDEFRVDVDTLDMESRTGAAVPADLGRRTVITADADGDWSGTLDLPTVLAGSGALWTAATVEALGFSAQMYWGNSTNPSSLGPPCNAGAVSDPCNPVAPFSTDLNWWHQIAPEDDGTWLTAGGFPGLRYSRWGLSLVVDASVTLWHLRFAARKVVGAFGNGDTSLLQFGLTRADAVIQYQNVSDALLPHGPAGTPFQVFDYTLDFTVPFGGDTHVNTALMNNITGGVGLPAGTGVDVAWWEFFPEGAAPSGSGLTDGLFPFHRNMVVLDATDCASDITVSHLLTELTTV